MGTRVTPQGMGLSMAEDVFNIAVKENSMEIARNLLDVLDDSTIAQKTSLTVKQVSALRQSVA